MSEVREFIFSLMIISVSCAAVNMLSPENSTVSKYVHFVVALIVTVVMLSPLQSVMDVLPKLAAKDINIDISDGSVDISTYADSVISATCDNIETEMSDMLEKRFSLRPIHVDVSCDTRDIENIIIEHITVTYSKSNSLLFSDTKKYIEDIMECKCEVIAEDEDT